MVRALVLIAVFVGLLAGSAMNAGMRDVMALAGVFAACWCLNWLTSQPER